MVETIVADLAFDALQTHILGAAERMARINATLSRDSRVNDLYRREQRRVREAEEEWDG